MQNEVESLLSEYFGSGCEWYTANTFDGCCGCSGHVFRSELAAVRYIYGEGLQMYMDYCDSACTESDWINILSKYYSRKKAERVINAHNWAEVVRMMTKAEGPAFFLSEYSGRVNELSNGYLLYF